MKTCCARVKASIARVGARWECKNCENSCECSEKKHECSVPPLHAQAGESLADFLQLESGIHEPFEGFPGRGAFVAGLGLLQKRVGAFEDLIEVLPRDLLGRPLARPQDVLQAPRGGRLRYPLQTPGPVGPGASMSPRSYNPRCLMGTGMSIPSIWRPSHRCWPIWPVR